VRTIGEVVNLFGGSPPAAEGSSKVSDFVDAYMGDFLAAVKQLDDAATEEEFEEAKAEVESLVAAWPK
jgi:hypothetical protein